MLARPARQCEIPRIFYERARSRICQRNDVLVLEAELYYDWLLSMIFTEVISARGGNKPVGHWAVGRGGHSLVNVSHREMIV